jgi:hypothetical protein
MQGVDYQIDKESLLALLIKKVFNEEQQPFIDHVDKILAAKKVAQPSWLSNYPEQDAPDTIYSDTTEWEKEIDQLVYQLYELTDAEIAIVEGRG